MNGYARTQFEIAKLPNYTQIPKSAARVHDAHADAGRGADHALPCLPCCPTSASKSAATAKMNCEHRGTAYMRAIQHFYKKFNRYPARVEELENTNNVRFLRRRYTDPMNFDKATGKEKDFKFLHQQDISLNNGPVLPGQTPGQNSPGGAGVFGGGPNGPGGFGGGPQGGPGGFGTQPNGPQQPGPGGQTSPGGNSGNSSSGDPSSGNSSSGNSSDAGGNSNSPGSSSSGSRLRLQRADVRRISRYSESPVKTKQKPSACSTKKTITTIGSSFTYRRRPRRLADRAGESWNANFRWAYSATGRVTCARWTWIGTRTRTKPQRRPKSRSSASNSAEPNPDAPTVEFTISFANYP